MTTDPPVLSPVTRLVTRGRPDRGPDVPVNPPVTLTSTYHGGGEIGYGRYGNPTWSALEDVIADLEGGEARVFASGLAASSAIVSLLPEGAIVVAPTAAYLGVIEQLREREAAGRLVLRQVPVDHTPAVKEALDGADLLWLESPTNPMLEVADLPACIDAARAAGARVVVDNTFATPLLQRPLDLGADIVMHSATKLMSGHSDVVMGAVVAREPAVIDRIDGHRKLHGAIPGPMETFLVLRGLRTLAVRLDRAAATAADLAGRLAAHPAVEKVRYPGFGTMISIEVRGGADAADRFTAALRLWLFATSLGGVESSLERRRRWPSELDTVPESLVRMSLGLEDADDLWADLAQALDSIA
jgi:cystathionine gamma-synthase